MPSKSTVAPGFSLLTPFPPLHSVNVSFGSSSFELLIIMAAILEKHAFIKAPSLFGRNFHYEMMGNCQQECGQYLAVGAISPSVKTAI